MAITIVRITRTRVIGAVMIMRIFRVLSVIIDIRNTEYKSFYVDEVYWGY